MRYDRRGGLPDEILASAARTAEAYEEPVCIVCTRETPYGSGRLGDQAVAGGMLGTQRGMTGHRHWTGQPVTVLAVVLPWVGWTP